jgi:hypothetical protein
MSRRLPALLLLASVSAAQEYPKEKLREEAKPDVIAGWREDFRTKRDLVPAPPAPFPSSAEAPDFRGRWRCGNYSYVLEIEQSGDRVVFTAGGVDRQDIGGAFDTLGIGVVDSGRIRARWWCLDLSRNLANNGGCEIWFLSPHRLRYRYYHDSDETIEEGYAVREGEHPGETPPYRVRVPQPGKSGPIEIRGTVTGRDGEAIADAVVLQRHAESTAVRTDGSGSFVLRLPDAPAVLLVSAAARGYRNAAEAILFQEIRDLHFVLDREPAGEDPGYAFVDPTPEKGREIWRCGNCHRNSYAEWAASRHAVSATNAVTLAVYRKDFLPALESGRAKGDPGLCAACHAPEAALRDPGIGLDRVTETALRGNHCDLCHKVHHTEDADAPGVRGSLVVTLPAAEGSVGPIRRVYGPLPDSDYLFMGAVYNPFFTTSLLCAGCHQHRTPEGIPALDTYREWLRWASAEAEPKSCQECHMPAGESREGKDPAARICVNALRRPKEQIHHHGFVGREKAPQAARLEVETALEGGRLRVTSRVTNAGGGHRLPTGSGDKHLLLVVLAKDASGRALPAGEGPRLPDHAGEWAGRPGREFAQVLADDSGATHVPFWRAARVVEDTRLEPGKTEETVHLFDLPGPGRLEVEVSLWHRLRFAEHDVAEGVTGPGARPRDLLLASRTLSVEGER